MGRNPKPWRQHLQGGLRFEISPPYVHEGTHSLSTQPTLSHSLRSIRLMVRSFFASSRVLCQAKRSDSIVIIILLHWLSSILQNISSGDKLCRSATAYMSICIPRAGVDVPLDPSRITYPPSLPLLSSAFPLPLFVPRPPSLELTNVLPCFFHILSKLLLEKRSSHDIHDIVSFFWVFFSFFF